MITVGSQKSQGLNLNSLSGLYQRMQLLPASVEICVFAALTQIQSVMMTYSHLYSHIHSWVHGKQKLLTADFFSAINLE